EASAAVAGAIAIVFVSLPDPAPPLAPAVADLLLSIGLGNAVTAVLLAYRGIDTLLESIVVVFALIGVWSLALDHLWGGYPGPRQYADPNGILAYLARLLPPIGIIVGLYIFWVGADLPGGKFQGATILAAMWLLAVMAGLADQPDLAANSAGCRTAAVYCDRIRGRSDCRCGACLSGRLRQAND